MTKYLKLSAVKCKVCGAVCVSTHVHDFQSCRCPEGYVYADGGYDYLRYGFNKRADIEVLDNIYLGVPGEEPPPTAA